MTREELEELLIPVCKEIEDHVYRFNSDNIKLIFDITREDAVSVESDWNKSEYPYSAFRLNDDNHLEEGTPGLIFQYPIKKYDMHNLTDVEILIKTSTGMYFVGTGKFPYFVTKYGRLIIKEVKDEDRTNIMLTCEFFDFDAKLEFNAEYLKADKQGLFVNLPNAVIRINN